MAQEPGKEGEKKKKSAAPLLESLKPEWIGFEARHGVGVSFQCPRCLAGRLAVLFANPLDGGPPVADLPEVLGNNRGRRWTRHGDAFATLTMTPHADGTRPDGAQLGYGQDELCESGGRSHWHGIAHAGALL